jgi:predicted nuclease of predicted toxin-antitoxin system
MAQLSADEHVPRRVVEQLRLLGHHVLTAYEAGNANQRIPDEHVLAFATRVDRAVLTMNRRDFLRLHRNQPNHAGLIVCTLDADAERQAQRIHAAIQHEQSLTGKLFRVNRPSE